jgi:calcium/proton exchanger cax
MNFDHEAHENDANIHRGAAVFVIFVTAVLVTFCAESLVRSIEDVIETSFIGETFIGLIVLPIVGNAAEHITSIQVAMRNKMDVAIGVTIGSSIQIATLITPLVVLLGWALRKEMTLFFTLFETACLFVSAFTVNFLVLNGRSNYMEGILLCAVYVIMCVVAFFYPDNAEAGEVGFVETGESGVFG